jgi:GT2 family glycosyltransferase
MSRLVDRSEPELATVVVNWNGWEDTLACLDSLAQTDYPDLHVIVVDNGSTDDSVARLLESPVRFTLIEAGENLGFAGGNNLGIRRALADGAELIWLLNNDTVVSPDAPRKLAQFATEHKDAADFFGSWITLYDKPDVLWFGGGLYDWRTGALGNRYFNRAVRDLTSAGSVYETAWVTGCSVVVHASRLEQLGLMDEDLFLYQEEVEWQLRNNARTPRGLILAEPLVSHKVGRSSGGSRGYLGSLFMSRNFLKLAFRYAGIALPIWIACWAKDFIAQPLVKRDRAAVRGAIASLRHYRTPGKAIVATARKSMAYHVSVGIQVPVWPLRPMVGGRSWRRPRAIRSAAGMTGPSPSAAGSRPTICRP